MLNDHTGANIDHTPVFNDHTGANIDHRGVFNDHRGVFSMHSMVIDINIDHNSGFSPNFNDHRPVFRMRSMVIFMHIDYNNGCTRVFRMCLMVIDMCIDKTLGTLAPSTPRLLRIRSHLGRGLGARSQRLGKRVVPESPGQCTR